MRITEVKKKVKEITTKLKNSEKHVKELKQAQMNSAADTVLSNSETLKGVNYTASKLNSSLYEKNDLQVVLDSVGAKLKPNGVCVMTHESEGNVALLVAVSKDLHGKVKAGDLVKNIAETHGGRGGGRPDKARAGIKGSGIEDQILKTARETLTALL